MSKHSQQPPLERVARKPGRRNRRSLIRWTKRVVLALAATGIVAAVVVSMMPEKVRVDTAVVARGPLEVEIREDGQTRVRDRFVIAAPISGELERIDLDPGAPVEPGMVIARIQPATAALLDDRTRSELTARVAAARVREKQAASAIARARFARDAAIREANRTRKLEAGGATTASDRERAELAEQLATEDLASAELQRAAAVAEIEALRVTLKPRHTAHAPLEVRAPTKGRVLRIARESAGPVAAGTPLVELGDPTALEVVIDVLSRDAERIRPGMPVELRTTSPEPLRATVRIVEPAAFTRISALGVEEQRVNVIASLDAPTTTLGDGYRVDARIITWSASDVLQAPASALFRDRGTWSVYTVEGQHARLRHVGVGHRGRLDVEITSGLEPGMNVIVHPSDRVKDGVQVTPR